MPLIQTIPRVEDLPFKFETEGFYLDGYTVKLVVKARDGFCVFTWYQPDLEDEVSFPVYRV